VWRSELESGWNWDEDLKPYAEGPTTCPMTHREYVVERFRYLSIASGMSAAPLAGGVWAVTPERKTPLASLGVPLGGHNAQAVRLRRPTRYPLSYRRADRDDTR
jgi:hypothetical protein